MMTHLMKGTLMPVFLKELLLAFWLFFARFLGSFQILFESLFFWQSPSTFNLFPFLLHANFFFFLLFDAAELPHPPCFKLSLGIQTIRVINIGNSFLLLLCDVMFTANLYDVIDCYSLSASSRLILSATILCDCLRLSSASCSFRLIDSSES